MQRVASRRHPLPNSLVRRLITLQSVLVAAALLLAGCDDDAVDQPTTDIPIAADTENAVGTDREPPPPRIPVGERADGSEGGQVEVDLEAWTQRPAPNVVRDRGCGWHDVRAPGADERLASQPVLDAVLDGDLERLQRLLDDGADPDEADRYIALTPLVAAISADCDPAALLLLDAGADPELGAFPGHRPLLYAARRDNVEMARRLIDDGADPLAVGGPDTDVFEQAITAGSVDVIRLLLDAGVDPDEHRSSTTRRPLERALNPVDERWALLVEAGAEPRPSFYYAAISADNIDAVRFLLAIGVDPTPPVPTPWGDDAFDDPVAYARHNGRHAIADLLEQP